MLEAAIDEARKEGRGSAFSALPDGTLVLIRAKRGHVRLTIPKRGTTIRTGKAGDVGSSVTAAPD
jgi:hypothetical protein